MPVLPLTHVYLSPHLDDAVLSCGGMIHHQTQAGEAVTVVTLCAGWPASGPTTTFAESLHARWRISAAQAVSARQAEDRAALQVLNAKGQPLDIPDCIYRFDPANGQALYASEEALWGEVHPAEAGLIQQATGALQAILSQFPAGRLYVPLTLGHHVDHQLARRAAEQTGRVWAYYEDYPYADRAARLAPHSKVTGDETSGLTPHRIFLTDADLRAKGRAVAAYASQISTFWSSPAEMEASLRAYAAHVGGGQWAETLWHTPAVSET